MDISAAFTVATQSLNIVKQLSEIDRNYDKSLYKSQMAELHSNLADLKMSLSDAREVIHEKNSEIERLNKRIEDLTSGETCPICNEGKMKTTSVHKHPTFGKVGIQEKTFTCSNCNHVEKRIHDPADRIGKK